MRWNANILSADSSLPHYHPFHVFSELDPSCASPKPEQLRNKTSSHSLSSHFIYSSRQRHNIVGILPAAHPASHDSAAGLQMAGPVPSVLGKSHRRRIKRGIDWLPRTRALNVQERRTQETQIEEVHADNRRKNMQTVGLTEWGDLEWLCC